MNSPFSKPGFARLALTAVPLLLSSIPSFADSHLELERRSSFIFPNEFITVGLPVVHPQGFFITLGRLNPGVWNGPEQGGIYLSNPDGSVRASYDRIDSSTCYEPAVLKNGNIAVGVRFSRVFIFDANARLLSTFQGSMDSVHGSCPNLAAMKNGGLAVSDEENGIHFLNAQGALLRSYPELKRAALLSLPNGNILASSPYWGAALFNPAGVNLARYAQPVFNAISLSHRSILVAQPGRVTLLNPRLDPIRAIPLQSSGRPEVSVSSDGSAFAAGSLGSSKVEVFKLDGTRTGTLDLPGNLAETTGRSVQFVDPNHLVAVYQGDSSEGYLQAAFFDRQGIVSGSITERRYDLLGATRPGLIAFRHWDASGDTRIELFDGEGGMRAQSDPIPHHFQLAPVMVSDTSFLLGADGLGGGLVRGPSGSLLFEIKSR